MKEFKSNSDVRKPWTIDEDHAIKTLVKKHGTHRWTEISKRMLDHFGEPGRTGKQCRERYLSVSQRWHNYLNPKIKREPWSQQQEKRLFQIHEEFGNKWKQISRHLDGRTDNDIKNKFYSAMRKKLRKISKTLGVKNSTSQVKEIKPKILSNILSSIEKQSPHLITFLKNFNEDRSHEFSETDKEIAKQLTDTINNLNNQYRDEKKQKPRLDHIPMRTTRSKQSQMQKDEILKKKPSQSSVKQQWIKLEEEQSNGRLFTGQFNFSIGDNEENHSFFNSTPVSLFRRGSMKESDHINRGFMLASPQVTRNFYSPMGPSPSPGFGGNLFEPKAKDFTQNRLDNVLQNLKRRIRKQ